jgi:hypothetical protein
MALGMRQWLEMRDESAYGVTQIASPQIDWIRLTGDNSFTVVPKRMRTEIRSADGRNRPVMNIPGRFSLTGRLNVLLYSDAGGGAAPICQRLLDWATTLTADDISSKTLRHWDGIRAREYLGVKVTRLHVYAAAETEEGLWRAEVDLVAQKMNAVDPTLTEPAITVFPKSPYVFPESKGGLIVAAVGSTPRTLYRNFDLTIANNLQPTYDEDIYISAAPWCGRTIDWLFATQFKGTTDRTNYENQASHTGSIVLTKVSPAHTLTLTFNAANYMTDLDRTLNLGNVSYETIHMRSFVDTVAGSDFTFAAT